MITAKTCLLIAASYGASGVAFGAFGAHALRDKLSDSLLNAWQTAVQYQLIHTVVLMSLAVLLLLKPNSGFANSAGLFSLGILLFSGSLYLLALGAPSKLGIITPIGGSILIAAWLHSFYSALQLN